MSKVASSKKKIEVHIEHIRILQRQQNDTLNAVLNWKNPLDEAVVEVDEETLAFVEKQRGLKQENLATFVGNKPLKGLEMDMSSLVKEGAMDMDS